MIAEYFIYANALTNDDIKKEGYHTACNCEYDMNNQKQQVKPLSKPILITIYIIYFIMGIYAARLSWYSNTKAGWDYGYKVLFSLFAFMFPMTYITAHFIFKIDLLNRIKKSSKYSM